jgi:hypothetical protein
MHILDKIIEKPEGLMADADHPDRKDISPEAAQEALNELGRRYAKPFDAAFTPKEAADREQEILQTLNSTENPY